MKQEQEMSWRYQNLLNTLQMKKSEIDRLGSEFEKSIRAKEEEQHSLKRELAALAISMNMEAQKKRHMTVDTSQQAKRTTAREILDGLKEQDREGEEKGAVEASGRRYENRKRELEQTTHGKEDRIRARQRQGKPLVKIRAWPW
jgi:hypothetical protein